MRTLQAAIAIGLTLAALDARADTRPKDFETDFYFKFFACRTVGTSLGIPPGKNDGFVVDAPQPHETFCQRLPKKRLDCFTVFEEKDSKPVRYELRIVSELTELLIIEGDAGGDFMVAKPQTSRVVSSTRMLGDTYFATKTCHGIYLTGDELRAMKARRAPGTAPSQIADPWSEK